MVAVPGYVREFLEIEIGVPATIQEALARVQSVREHEPASLFPHLLPVSPQPCPGSGFLLANPAWDVNRRSVCLNTTAIDGRIFAVVGPAYVNKSQLLVLANLPPNLGVEVFEGHDQMPLREDVILHVQAGSLFTFALSDRPPPQFFELGQALLFATAWSSTCTVPRSPRSNAYCIVFGHDNILHLYDEAFPMTYRERIARAVGVASSCMRLFPTTWTPVLSCFLY